MPPVNYGMQNIYNKYCSLFAESPAMLLFLWQEKSCDFSHIQTSLNERLFHEIKRPEATGSGIQIAAYHAAPISALLGVP
jgi:hypothetical protein